MFGRRGAPGRRAVFLRAQGSEQAGGVCGAVAPRRAWALAPPAPYVRKAGHAGRAERWGRGQVTPFFACAGKLDAARCHAPAPPPPIAVCSLALAAVVELTGGKNVRALYGLTYVAAMLGGEKKGAKAAGPAGEELAAAAAQKLTALYAGGAAEPAQASLAAMLRAQGVGGKA